MMYKFILPIIVFCFLGCKHIKTEYHNFNKSKHFYNFEDSFQIVNLFPGSIPDESGIIFEEDGLFEHKTIYGKFNYLRFDIQGRQIPLNKSDNIEVISVEFENKTKKIVSNNVEVEFKNSWSFVDTTIEFNKLMLDEPRSLTATSKTKSGEKIYILNTNDTNIGHYSYSVTFNESILMDEGFKIKLRLLINDAIKVVDVETNGIHKHVSSYPQNEFLYRIVTP